MNNIEIRNVDTKLGPVKLVTLRSRHLEVVLTSYGAGIYQMRYNGLDLVTHPLDLDDYLTSTAYYGKTIGRYSGRIQGPNYQIDRNVYEVDVDKNEPFQLHSGDFGLSNQHFQLTGYEHVGSMYRVKFSCLLKAYEDGFPGNLHVEVMYELTKDEALTIHYKATTSEPTLCNLTNHVYLNLSQNKETIKKHKLYINSDYYLNVDKDYRILSINQTVDTPFDFRLPTLLEHRLHQVKQPDIDGYDHCFLLNKHDDQQAVFTLIDTESNMALDVFTNYPSLVLYTHNHPATVPLKDISSDGVHSSVTIECQYPPDGIHHSSLYNAILRPGEIEQKLIKIKPYLKK